MSPAVHLYTIFPHEIQQYFFVCFHSLVVRVILSFVFRLDDEKNEKRIQFIIYLSRRLKSNGVSISPHFICICWWFVFAQKQ